MFAGSRIKQQTAETALINPIEFNRDKQCGDEKLQLPTADYRLAATSFLLL